MVRSLCFFLDEKRLTSRSLDEIIQVIIWDAMAVSTLVANGQKLASKIWPSEFEAPVILSSVLFAYND